AVPAAGRSFAVSVAAARCQQQGGAGGGRCERQAARTLLSATGPVRVPEGHVVLLLVVGRQCPEVAPRSIVDDVVYDPLSATRSQAFCGTDHGPRLGTSHRSRLGTSHRPRLGTA